MMNVVCLMGRMVADPELRTTVNGTSVCSFAVAVNRNYKAEDGSYPADFVNCVRWKGTGEFVSKYFKKGSMIGLNGSIQTTTYTDKDTGKKRTAVEVVVNNAYPAGNRDNSVRKPNSTISRSELVEIVPNDSDDLPY